MVIGKNYIYILVYRNVYVKVIENITERLKMLLRLVVA